MTNTDKKRSYDQTLYEVESPQVVDGNDTGSSVESSLLKCDKCSIPISLSSISEEIRVELLHHKGQCLCPRCDYTKPTRTTHPGDGTSASSGADTDKLPDSVSTVDGVPDSAQRSMKRQKFEPHGSKDHSSVTSGSDFHGNRNYNVTTMDARRMVLATPAGDVVAPADRHPRYPAENRYFRESYPPWPLPGAFTSAQPYASISGTMPTTTYMNGYASGPSQSFPPSSVAYYPPFSYGNVSSSPTMSYPYGYPSTNIGPPISPFGGYALPPPGYPPVPDGLYNPYTTPLHAGGHAGIPQAPLPPMGASPLPPPSMSYPLPLGIPSGGSSFYPGFYSPSSTAPGGPGGSSYQTTYGINYPSQEAASFSLPTGSQAMRNNSSNTYSNSGHGTAGSGSDGAVKSSTAAYIELAAIPGLPGDSSNAAPNPSRPAPQIYYCTYPECRFRCSYKGHMKRHMIEHKSEDTGELFKCPYPGCTYTTAREGYLKCHKTAKKHY